MIDDEPPELARWLERYGRGLLGALLVDPSQAEGEEVAKLDVRDCPSELLARVLTALRWDPGIGLRDLLRVTALGQGCGSEIVRALEVVFPWNADFYAYQIARLQAKRREFWGLLKAAHEARFELLREF